MPVPATPAAPRLAVYVGTYIGGGSRGIYRFELDTASGAWTDPVLAGDSESPSILALHPGGPLAISKPVCVLFAPAPRERGPRDPTAAN